MISNIPTLWLGLGAGLLGAILGSFIGALVTRWPQGASVVEGRSACDNCGYQPKAYEMIPLLSWFMLRGKCRNCSERIDPIQPVAEWAGLAIGIAGMTLLPLPLGLSFVLFGWLALPSILLDFRHHWLPDRLTVILGLAGLGVTLWLGTGTAVLNSVTAVIAFATLEILRRVYGHIRNVEGMGAGDPKLFGAIALWTGPWLLPVIMLLASGAGIIWHFAARDKSPARFPLGALLLLGALGALLFQEQLLPL